MPPGTAYISIKAAPCSKVPQYYNAASAVPALLSVLLVTLLSVKLVSLPLNRILESRYCLEYYQAHDPGKIPSNGEVPESDCKLEVIQQRLGWLMGASDTTVQLCGQRHSMYLIVLVTDGGHRPRHGNADGLSRRQNRQKSPAGTELLQYCCAPSMGYLRG
ncbi:hypothetical protein PRZ48_002391 [Zasmidium cellare]|uniref:Uncharacterized protein n=1 Tax=Zasmidium cellare TaxID=395010 RepID=A0ABR0F435_ZASCE|nr:hypothetical protein PRZ48_002391 [Zasmidium cellare]